MSTDNLILCKDDIAKNWTPTATQTATNFSVLSLINQYRSDVWRSTDKTANYLTFNGATSYTVTIAVLVDHNITTGTLQLQHSDNDFTDHTDVNMTLITVPSKRYNATTKVVESYNVYHSYAYMAGGVSKKDYRIKIDASGIADAYYQAAEVCLFSTCYQVPENFMNDYVWRLETEKVENKGPYTNGPSTVLKRFRSGVFPFRNVGATQFGYFEGIEIHRGIVVFPQGFTGAGCYYGEGKLENEGNVGLLSTGHKNFDFVFNEHV